MAAEFSSKTRNTDFFYLFVFRLGFKSNKCPDSHLAEASAGKTPHATYVSPKYLNG